MPDSVFAARISPPGSNSGVIVPGGDKHVIMVYIFYGMDFGTQVHFDTNFLSHFCPPGALRCIFFLRGCAVFQGIVFAYFF